MVYVHPKSVNWFLTKHWLSLGNNIETRFLQYTKSPSHRYLQGKIDGMQRRATKLILPCRIGEMSYKERLTRLDLLPLVYDRELKDITFFYKCLYGQIALNAHGFVSFVTHGHTRLSNSFNLKNLFV